tara:strand:- start:162 stop:716 length:555 start_codon:yes stop_codon:yes gene_type:complete
MFYDYVDSIFNLLHVFVILLNTLGWVSEKTRRVSLLFLILTIFCWSIMGLFFGIGFCPLTYLHSEYLNFKYSYILPFSYMDHFIINIIDFNISSKIISIVSITFVFLSLYINLKKSFLLNKYIILFILLNGISSIFVVSFYDLGYLGSFKDFPIIISFILSTIMIILIFTKVKLFNQKYSRIKV